MPTTNASPAEFLSELRARLGQETARSQAERYEIAATTALEFGFIFKPEISGFGGLGAYLVGTGIDVSVPFSINQYPTESDIFSPRLIALTFNARSSNNSSVSFGISNRGFVTERVLSD